MAPLSGLLSRWVGFWKRLKKGASIWAHPFYGHKAAILFGFHEMISTTLLGAEYAVYDPSQITCISLISGQDYNKVSTLP
jgi:hypothetical protein